MERGRLKEMLQKTKLINKEIMEVNKMPKLGKVLDIMHITTEMMKFMGIIRVRNILR